MDWHGQAQQQYPATDAARSAPMAAVTTREPGGRAGAGQQRSQSLPSRELGPRCRPADALPAVARQR